jgi:TonB family protein
MKQSLFICLTVCVFAVFAVAQSDAPPFPVRQYPFHLFDKAVNEEVGFNGDKSKLSRDFSYERSQLGDIFEVELWKYLGNDVEKHYWIGSFLTSKSYLHADKPLPLLAFSVWQNGIKLTKDKEDEENVKRRYSLMILASVLADKIGKKDIAVVYKNEIELLQKEKPEIVGGSFPAMYKNELCIYNNIGKDTSICKEEIEPQNLKEIIFSGGVLNGKAIELPKPIYPEKGKKKNAYGKVTVKVIIDFDGQVISAKAIEGPTELFAASVEAAKKARFFKTLFSGKPVKVSGVITYNFPQLK